MAKLLVLNHTPNNSYTKNDVVGVFEDNHAFGSKELDLTLFRIVIFPGASVRRLNYLTNGLLQPLRNVLFLKNQKLRHKLTDIRKTEKHRRFYVDNSSNIVEK